MNINDLTIGQAKELAGMFAQTKEVVSKNELPFEVGNKYLLRTVTHIMVGEVTSIVGNHLILKDASWIAYTGRFMNCLKEGKFNEVEPVPDGSGLNADSLVYWFPWNHDLPKEQK